MGDTPRSHFKSTKTLEVSFRAVLAEGAENVRFEWVTLGTYDSIYIPKYKTK